MTTTVQSRRPPRARRRCRSTAACVAALPTVGVAPSLRRDDDVSRDDDVGALRQRLAEQTRLSAGGERRHGRRRRPERAQRVDVADDERRVQRRLARLGDVDGVLEVALPQAAQTARLSTAPVASACATRRLEARTFVHESTFAAGSGV